MKAKEKNERLTIVVPDSIKKRLKREWPYEGIPFHYSSAIRIILTEWMEYGKFRR